MIGASLRLPASSVAISSKSSMIATSAVDSPSQVPIENWHEVIADPTIADAVLDRLVHNAHRLALKGDSMRKSLRSAPIVTPPRNPDPIPHAGNHTPAAFVGTGGRIRSECMVAFNRNPVAIPGIRNQ